jgi:uncharacterized protein YciI
VTETASATSTAPIPPIRREVRVGAPIDGAFALFTAHIASWWPLAELSVHGDTSTVAFEGDLLVERNGAGTAVWAEVVAWDPPRELRLAWHPGADVSRATDLTVRFSADGDGTVVTVIQSGWEKMTDPAAAAEEYGHGWPEVLACFQAQVSAVTSGPDEEAAGSEEADAHDEPEAEWFALMHSPGPALGAGDSVFDHPMFAEHIAFLRRLLDRGVLVAAGPLMDDVGAGMTVVRVEPGRDNVDVVSLATTDDLCVAGGYLSVTVRPWSVQFST